MTDGNGRESAQTKFWAIIVLFLLKEINIGLFLFTFFSFKQSEAKLALRKVQKEDGENHKTYSMHIPLLRDWWAESYTKHFTGRKKK